MTSQHIMITALFLFGRAVVECNNFAANPDVRISAGHEEEEGLMSGGGSYRINAIPHWVCSSAYAAPRDQGSCTAQLGRLQYKITVLGNITSWVCSAPAEYGFADPGLEVQMCPECGLRVATSGVMCTMDTEDIAANTVAFTTRSFQLVFTGPSPLGMS